MMSTRNSISSINLTSSIPNSRKARPLPVGRHRSAPPWRLRACTASSPWSTKNRPLHCGTSLSWRGRRAGPSPPRCRTSLLSRAGGKTAFASHLCDADEEGEGDRREGDGDKEGRRFEKEGRVADRVAGESGFRSNIGNKGYVDKPNLVSNARGRLLLVGLEGQMRRGITIPRSLLCICL